MATHHRLIAFDRPLVNAVMPGRAGGRLYSESEVAAIRTAAHREGADSAREFAGQQLVELRTEVQALQSGLFERLAAAEANVGSQLRGALPLLAVEIARRLLAGYEPDAAQVEKLCAEALEQLYPEREGLELSVCPRDAALLENVLPSWRARYPGLRVVEAPHLVGGDCQVRSRFGVTDARGSAKLAALAHELLSA